LSAREGTLFIIQDGYHIVAVGRKGKGPGELEMPLGFQVKGNEVRIYDMNKAAVLLYTFHGSNIHQVTFKGRIDLERGIGCVFLDGGGYIVQTGFKDNRFAYFDADGTLIRRFGINKSKTTDPISNLLRISTMLYDDRNHQLLSFYLTAESFERFDLSTGKLQSTHELPFAAYRKKPQARNESNKFWIEGGRALKAVSALEGGFLVLLEDENATNDSSILAQLDEKGRLQAFVRLPQPYTLMNLSDQGLTLVNVDEGMLDHYPRPRF
jgi:hypothetical protein